MHRWLLINAEQVLNVDRGREVILCDRDIPHELLVQVSDAEFARLKVEIGGTPAGESIAAKALKAIGTGYSNIAFIKSQMPSGLTDKEIYNALAYLTRKKMVERIGYGLYRRPENRS